jgi:hypothetical protein
MQRTVSQRAFARCSRPLIASAFVGHGDPPKLMADDPMYHEGMRQLQDARETRPLADRLEQVTVRTAFTDEDRAFIQRCPMFFIATADARGRPDCSYKGGLPGFVHVLDDRTLAIPDYDGNGMYRTWGTYSQPAVPCSDFGRDSGKRHSSSRNRTEYLNVFIVRVTADLSKLPSIHGCN